MARKTDIWMPLYIGDYLADTAHLDAERSGAYLHLLMHYWRNGPLANDLDGLEIISKLRGSNARGMLQALLEQFFKLCEDNAWHQARQDREREDWQKKSQKATEKAQKAAESRWSDAPSIPKSNAQAMHEQCPLPSPLPLPKHNEIPNAAIASEIDSTPKPEKKPATLKAKEPRADIPVWMPIDAWEGFEEMRKKIRAPLTEHAKELLISKLDQWRQEGQDVAAALDQSTERGWRGVWPAEVTQEAGNGANQPSAAKQRVDGNRRAIADALAKRGVSGPWDAFRKNGAAVPEPGSVEHAGGIHGGSGSAGPEVLPPSGRGRNSGTTR